MPAARTLRCMHEVGPVVQQSPQPTAMQASEAWKDDCLIVRRDPDHAAKETERIASAKPERRPGDAAAALQQHDFPPALRFPGAQKRDKPGLAQKRRQILQANAPLVPPAWIG